MRAPYSIFQETLQGIKSPVRAYAYAQPMRLLKTLAWLHGMACLWLHIHTTMCGLRSWSQTQARTDSCEHSHSCQIQFQEEQTLAIVYAESSRRFVDQRLHEVRTTPRVQSGETLGRAAKPMPTQCYHTRLMFKQRPVQSAEERTLASCTTDSLFPPIGGAACGPPCAGTLSGAPSLRLGFTRWTF